VRDVWGGDAQKEDRQESFPTISQCAAAAAVRDKEIGRRVVRPWIFRNSFRISEPDLRERIFKREVVQFGYMLRANPGKQFY
jgi:hypothetical protein